MMQLQLDEWPKYFLASCIHRTETEEGLIFDETTAWQIALYQDPAVVQVIQKCSQVGVSVYAIISTIQHLRQGLPGIYVLPTKVMMEQFVKNRIDPILQDVPYYAENYALRKADAAGSQLKTLFNRRVKFAGSNVKNQFFEFPASWVIIDEHDLCDPVNLKYLDDRLGRAKTKRKIILGNPTYEDRGINGLFKSSDQKEWFVTCPHCKQEQTLDWMENCVRQTGKNKYVLRDRVVQAKINRLAKSQRYDIAVEIVKDQYDKLDIDARIYCKNADCQKVLNRHGPGRWIARHPERPTSGYHINKIFGDPYSPAILRLYYAFINSLHIPSAMEHFMNSDLGMPYEESGNRVTEAMLSACARDYSLPFKLPVQVLQKDISWTVCGVDVGERLHVHISAMWLEGFEIHRCKLFADSIGGGVDDRAFEELADLCQRLNVVSGVIDAMPEKRLSRKFVTSRPNWWMCWYNKSDTKKDMVFDEKTRELKLDRTEALDMSYAAIDSGKVILPLEWRSLDNGEFLNQMKFPVRFIDEASGAPRWTKGSDHHRHADTYEYFASRLSRTWAGMKGS